MILGSKRHGRKTCFHIFLEKLTNNMNLKTCKKCGSRAVYDEETNSVCCSKGCIKITGRKGKDAREIWNRIQLNFHTAVTWAGTEKTKDEQRQEAFDRRQAALEYLKNRDERRDYYENNFYSWDDD